MLHHLSVAVIDLARASAFYDAVLAPLGYVRVFADDEAVGELAHLDLPAPGRAGTRRRFSASASQPRVATTSRCNRAT